uniref:Uncharacterized protein n=1 Tax=Anguilla anguilla TaxID=7936 RepID=A0A0E9RA88_ANGAN
MEQAMRLCETWGEFHEAGLLTWLHNCSE